MCIFEGRVEEAALKARHESTIIHVATLLLLVSLILALFFSLQFQFFIYFVMTLALQNYALEQGS